jgi:hypothetical protein
MSGSPVVRRERSNEGDAGKAEIFGHGRPLRLQVDRVLRAEGGEREYVYRSNRVRKTFAL